MQTAVATDRRSTVSIREAADLVRVSRRTIYNWMDAGKVEFRRTAGGSVRIFEDSLWRDGGNQPERRSEG